MGNVCEPQSPTQMTGGAQGGGDSGLGGILEQCCAPSSDVIVTMQPAGPATSKPDAGDTLVLKRQIPKAPPGDLDLIYRNIRPFLNAGRTLSKEQRLELGLALVRIQPAELVELTRSLHPHEIEIVAEVVLEFHIWWVAKAERVQERFLERHAVDTEEVDHVDEFRLFVREYVSWSRRFRDNKRLGVTDYSSTPLTREFLRNSGIDLVRTGSVRIDTRPGTWAPAHGNAESASSRSSATPMSSSPTRSPQKSILKGGGAGGGLHLGDAAASPTHRRPADARSPDALSRFSRPPLGDSPIIPFDASPPRSAGAGAPRVPPGRQPRSASFRGTPKRASSVGPRRANSVGRMPLGAFLARQKRA